MLVRTREMDYWKPIVSSALLYIYLRSYSYIGMVYIVNRTYVALGICRVTCGAWNVPWTILLFFRLLLGITVIGQVRCTITITVDHSKDGWVQEFAGSLFVVSGSWPKWVVERLQFGVAVGAGMYPEQMEGTFPSRENFSVWVGQMTIPSSVSWNWHFSN